MKRTLTITDGLPYKPHRHDAEIEALYRRLRVLIYERAQDRLHYAKLGNRNASGQRSPERRASQSAKIREWWQRKRAEGAYGRREAAGAD